MLTRRTFGIAALAAAPLQAAIAAPAILPARSTIPFSHRFAEELPHLMEVAQVPAVGYAVLQNGVMTDNVTVGLRKAAGPPADAATRFCAASLTKPVFATIVLALAKHGAIDLNRTLQSYLPLFDDPLARTITARHVLSHSTGLTNWHYNLDKPLTAEFTPGTQWGYSGEAYCYLLCVVEHITGKPFAVLTEEYVFAPAAMRESSVTWSDTIAADNAWPHDNFGGPLDGAQLSQNIAINRNKRALAIAKPMEQWTTEDALAACTANGEKAVPGNAWPNPAFSLWTTPADYARFLLYAATDTRRAAPVIPLKGSLAWGLGWGLETGPEGPFAWHWGDSDGTKNIFILHLPSQTGLVVFTNGDSGAHIYRRMARHAFAREFDAFLWI